MPPAKIRALQEDSRSEDSAALHKSKSTLQSATGRGRRNGGQNLTNGSNLKEVVSANSSTSNLTGHGNGTGSTQNGTGSGIPWQQLDQDFLETYRSAHRLPSAPAFKNPLAHAILNHGIGKLSPTMVQAKTRRRTTKDQLALQVRKHFNSLAVSENDVVVSMMYKVKSQDKAFRLKFGPNKTR